MRYYGVPNPIVRFYETFYQGMGTVYEVMGHLTTRIPLLQCNPQGDPSSPILYLIKQQPFMDRLMIRNVCLPIQISHNRLDVELQGYADDLDAPLGTAAQHTLLQDEWSRQDQASNSKMNVDKLRQVSFPPKPYAESPDWRNQYLPQDDELTIFGRAQVANTLLTSSLWHALQLCPLNKNADKLTTVRQTLQTFVLGSRRCFLKWETITTPRHLGGLGVIDPKAMCTAMNGRAIIKTVLKSTEPQHNTNTAHLLRLWLSEVGHRIAAHPDLQATLRSSSSKEQQDEQTSPGIYIWLIRKGKHWHGKEGLTPLLSRIAHTMDTLQFAPHLLLHNYGPQMVLHLPLYCKAYQSATDVPSKHVREALRKAKTHPWPAAYAIEDFGDQMGKFQRWGIYTFGDILTYDNKAQKYKFALENRKQKQEYLKNAAIIYSSPKERKLHQSDIATLAHLCHPYWTALPKALKKSLEQASPPALQSSTTEGINHILKNLTIAETPVYQYSVRIGRQFLSPNTPITPLLWQHLQNAGMVDFSNTSLPNLWPKVTRGGLQGPSRTLAYCWQFLHMSVSTHTPSKAQKANFEASAQPTFIIGECTTCGKSGRDTPLHAFLLCPAVTNAWEDSARFLDNSEYPGLPTTGVYGFLEPQHIATAFTNILPGNTQPIEDNTTIFKWWASTISAIYTRRISEFTKARNDDRDAKVDYTGIAKDVQYLMTCWQLGEPTSDAEDLLVYSTSHWSENGAENLTIGKDIEPPRKRTKKAQDATPQLAETPAPPPNPYATHIKSIIRYGREKAKGNKQPLHFTIRFFEGPDLKLSEPEVRRYANGAAKMDAYKKKKNIAD
ncbi:hypothetical protein BJ508DRAFT_336304 [Ascobolus immersus RN42]|uniref:Reverse transcriptase zinc-binding domain-containing protein n=1 Tax=Ascobolus immersus RN42 TaxID=1160509 RepID=A0A3N4HGG2_ASCIM|nr:hypothetical protein BJ508DRAFT_336304 [Ascobolus immersus RN42]